ncbi:hypothetical protein [Desulfobulbus elongatus]|uniref:hypothetical protein n=1 Tax=Desulfobulbus elongatus TaxID=53332 RepID=UPI0004806649|nr:hypothetical protein [Desulfobulbus elongatus]
MIDIVINEGSTSYHTLHFLSPDGRTHVQPEALRYCYNSSNGAEIIPWTSLPADATEIVIPGAANLIGEGEPWRHLTIEATHDGGHIITGEARYLLRNLKGH